MIRLISLLFSCLQVISCNTLLCFAADGLNLSGVALTPSSRVVPGQVMFLAAKMENTGAEAAEGKVVVTIDELPGLQSIRHVTVPPGRSEQFELTIPLPQETAKFKVLNFVTTVYVSVGSREVILEHSGAPVISTLRLSVTQGRIFASATEPEPPVLPIWYWPTAPPPMSYEWMTAARIDAGGTRLSASYEWQSLPVNQLQWNGLDLFVISESSPLRDPAAVEAMREFLARGGRVWVMLDKVPAALIRPLLGTGQMCEEVERVELNDFVVDFLPNLNQLAQRDRMVSSKQDVRLTRIIQAGGQVSHQVDGWPIAVTMNIGYGQLILTMLDSFAWILPREANPSNPRSTGVENQPVNDQLTQSSYQSRLWATSFAVRANEQRADLPLSQPVEYPLRLIGNPVVPKSNVATALLSFCGLLLTLGLVLAYVRRLPAVGVVAPVAAVVVSMALLVAASWIRRDIPESVTRLQFVDIGDNGSFASIREQAAVYLATAADMRLECNMDGVMHSSEAVTTGMRSLVTQDFQQWHVANQDWPPGAWRYDSEYVQKTQGLVARAKFSAQGVELTVPPGLPSELEDAVLAYVVGDPLRCEPTATGLRVDNQVAVGADTWIAETFLSDEQQRRADIYQRFFEPIKFFRRPAARLYGWTTPWSSSKWNRELKQQGAALVAIPVELDRPAIGEKVLVPHGLIQLRRRSDQSNLTSAYDDLTGKWLDEIGMASQIGMEFILPKEVVPLELQSIEFELDVVAPHRTVTVSMETPTGAVEIANLQNPSLPFKTTITDPAVLKAFQHGRLPVSLIISELSLDNVEVGNNNNVWRIDHMHIGVQGQILPMSSLSQSL